ncbi:MAG: glucose-6-phosphate dehydrogenase [Candidatus Hydrogenedentota bacterium]
MFKQPTAAFREDFPEKAGSDRIPFDKMGTIVIFGATGDLAGRKLIPAIYNLWEAGYLPPEVNVVGIGRRDKSDSDYRTDMCEELKKHSRTGQGGDDECDPFISNLFYHRLNFAENPNFTGLARRLTEIEDERDAPHNRLFYLATGPEFFAPLVERLGDAGLVRRPDDPCWSRVVIEKPFGHDLESARKLNQAINRILTEDQIYRIDHYLGKETVQNIFAFRFGNAIFEPLFNQKYVDHVQITVAETLGVEGRGEFYDATGALHDVVQNHALQLLCLAAMEPPVEFGPKDIRDEKLKALRSIHLPNTEDTSKWLVRGQYAEGFGQPGYLSEEEVDPNSETETFIALRLSVDNWRWAGVPFFIRSGKRLKKRLTEIAIRFRKPPLHYFKKLGVEAPEANELVFRIQPNEAISLSFNAKPPGMDFRIRPVNMDFRYGHTFREDLPDAYERLLLDALRGDSTLFTRADEIEVAWEIVNSIRDAWQGQPPPELYRPQSWGPVSADRLFDCCQGHWRTPEEEDEWRSP